MTLIVLNQVIIMMIYMTIGFVCCKAKFAVPSHAKTLSGLLIYILGPAMIINAFVNTEYSLQTLGNIVLFFCVTLATQTLFFIILYGIFHKKYKDAKYRIMTLGSVLGNVGFFGLPLITSMFPDQPIVACYSSIHVMSMNLLVFTIGEYLITNDRKTISLKGAFCNPTTLSIVIALPLFIFDIELPTFIASPIDALGKMVIPVCMIILGMRLSTVGLKSLFSQKFVYGACALKLIAYPLFASACVSFLPVDNYFKISVFVLGCAPSGAVIASLAELRECEQELSANVVLLTTILCVITIPLMVTLML